MELRHLRAFVAVIDAGGFAPAAARLNASQPALSRQIAALERDLRVTLFDRLGRGVALTADGEELATRARRLLDDAASLVDRAGALRHGESGVLRVGATPQTIESVLAAFLVHHRRKHADVEVHLVEDGGVRLPARLQRGEIHLGLIPAPDARFDGRLLFPVYLMAVLPAAHCTHRRTAVEVRDLAGQPLLLLRREFGSRRWFDAACEVAHIRPRVLLESGAPHTVLSLARAGYGIALVPSNVPLPVADVQSYAVVQNGVPVAGWVSVAWHPRRVLPRYAQRFVEELSAYTRRSYPGRGLTRSVPRVPRPAATAAGRAR